MLAVTGVNGLVGGALFHGFRQAGLDPLALSTRPAEASVIQLTDGRPQAEPPRPVTALVHCGGLVGGGHDREAYFKANVRDLTNLLDWAEDRRIEHFIYFSSGGVYGPAEGWIDEDAPLNPGDDYARSKVLAEEAVAARLGCRAMIVRLYFPIGPFSRPHFFANLSRRLLEGRAFISNAQGRPRLSPVSLEDVTAAMLAAVHLKLTGVFNLSANTALTMIEILDILAEAAGAARVSPSVASDDPRPGDYLGRSDRLVKAAGLAPFQSVTKILRRRAGEPAQGAPL